MIGRQGGNMRTGDKVKVSHWHSNGPTKFRVPVYHPDSLGHLGYIECGDIVEVVGVGLMGSDGWGLASAGYDGDSEVIHPQLGRCLIEGAYLEVV